jgi:small-conductance mechanosensitive channel
MLARLMQNLLSNPYLLAVGIGLLAYILILGLKLILSTKVAKFVGSTGNKWDDVVVFAIEKTTQFFMLSSALYLGIKFVKDLPSINLYSDRIYFIIVMWQIAIWSHHLLDKYISSAFNKKMQRNRAAASSISLIQFLARMILFTIIFLFTLSNLGIRITTIIAGLGVGGIAVALALQKILGDLFSSLSIVLDKPFEVGDFIIIDQFLGEVEKIGLKTTRIRSLSGEQIIFSNSDLLAARIRNFKRMHERRVSFITSFPLHTSTSKVRSAVSLISAIIRTKRNIRFERCHFMGMSGSLDVETVYWVLSDDYDLHMDIQQDILFDIKIALESESIKLAYPTQTLNVMPTEIWMKNDYPPDRGDKKPADSVIS